MTDSTQQPEGWTEMIHGIPARVDRLETTVEALHQDSIRTQGILGAVSTQLEGLSNQVRDFDTKLDAQRTRKPNLTALIAAVMMILAIGTATLSPLYRSDAMSRQDIGDVRQQLDERAYMIGAFTESNKFVQEQIKELRRDVNSMQSNRFTKQDGQRLENKVDGFHE